MNKSVISPSYIFPLGFLEQVGNQTAAPLETGNYWFLISLIIVAALILLVALTFWLLKNSTQLEQAFGKSEIEGRSWLKNHLNELEIDQLETLINLKSVRANQNLPDDNSDQQ